MTKIQLKKLLTKIFTYNNTELVEYDNLNEIARA